MGVDELDNVCVLAVIVDDVVTNLGHVEKDELAVRAVMGVRYPLTHAGSFPDRHADYQGPRSRLRPGDGHLFGGRRRAPWNTHH